MNQVNWGIIGCGDVTEQKSGPAFNKIEGSKLIAVMRRDREKAADYARRHHVSKFYDNDDLINDPEINAIYIATPPSSHKEYTLKAALAGKHVYVEKPMALNHQECLEMIKACESAQVKLFVAYYRRCLPNFLKVKELIDAGAIGDIRMVNLNLYLPFLNIDKKNLPWRLIPEFSGGGLFYDLAPHQLDILDYFFGPIKLDSINGLVLNQAGLYNVEDIVTANFCFESGVMGCGSWCFSADENGRKDFVEILGSRGRIEFSTFDFAPIKLIKNNEVKEITYTMPEHIQMPFIQTIVDELLGKGICPGTGYSAARTSLVMDKIFKI
jgi:predicted dehydrogenase